MRVAFWVLPLYMPRGKDCALQTPPISCLKSDLVSIRHEANGKENKSAKHSSWGDGEQDLGKNGWKLTVFHLERWLSEDEHDEVQACQLEGWCGLLKSQVGRPSAGRAESTGD